MPNFLTSQTIDNFMISPDARHARHAIGLIDIESLSGNWNSTYSTVYSNSAFWDGDFCNETVLLNQVSACNGNMTIDGNINMSAGNITNVDTLCASVIHSISSFTQYHDIQVSELSGFKVTGDVEVTGDVSVANITTLSGGNNTTWDSVYTTVNAASSTWDSVYNDVAATSGDWNSVYNSVLATSGDWNSVYNDVVATSANWDSVYNSVLSTSADWDSVYNSVLSTSADWDSTYNSVLATSANWDSVYSDVVATSSDWNSVYKDVVATSANWDSVYSDVVATSSDWNSVYNSVLATSANWDSSYNSTGALSGDWSSVYNSVLATSGDWDSTYNTVYSNSANWDGDFCDEVVLLNQVSACDGSLTFDGNIDMQGGNITSIDTLCATAIHSISSVTHYQDIIISELSGFNVTGDVVVEGNVAIVDTLTANNISAGNAFYTDCGNSDEWCSTNTTVEATSANWDSVYNTTQTQSAGWLDTETVVQTNSAQWSELFDSSLVEATSANWDSVYNDVVATSATWNDSTSVVQTNSAQWADSYANGGTINGELIVNDCVVADCIKLKAAEIQDYTLEKIFRGELIKTPAVGENIISTFDIGINPSLVWVDYTIVVISSGPSHTQSTHNGRLSLSGTQILANQELYTVPATPPLVNNIFFDTTNNKLNVTADVEDEASLTFFGKAFYVDRVLDFTFGLEGNNNDILVSELNPENEFSLE